MKRIICIVLCLLMITAAFAGCANKPATFEEAAAAGREFIKNEELKDVKIVTEADGTKTVLEGKYDPKNEKAVFSVSIESKDTVNTVKEMIKLDGKKLYIKIPDMSGFEKMFGGVVPFGYSEITELDGTDGLYVGDIEYEDKSIDENELEEELSDYVENEFSFGIPDVGFNMPDDITGKYVMIKLPENTPETISSVFSDAEDEVYEKAEKLEGDKEYPYVVKYTQKSAYDLIISVLDGIKEKKTAIASEAAAMIKEYLGEDNSKSLEDVSGKKIEGMISDGIDEFFKNVKPEDIAPENAEEFEVIQKIAYDAGKKLEYVFTYDVKEGEETHTVKTTVTVAAAEADAAFAEKCAVSEEETFDVAGYLQNMFKQMQQLKDLFSIIK